MTDITWHDHAIDRQQRESLLGGQKGCVVWFTGLSGSGKSTVANAVDYELHQRGVKSYLLDGDNVRHGLNAGVETLRCFGDEYAERFGLGFGAEDRQENIRRIAAVAQLFASAGLVTLTAFVSPYRKDRQAARDQINSAGADDFVEVFVDTPLDVCEKRDPKGLYKKARTGEIKNFTGISDPYEAPTKPELHMLAGEASPQALAQQVIAFLGSTGRIPSS